MDVCMYVCTHRLLCQGWFQQLSRVWTAEARSFCIYLHTQIDCHVLVCSVEPTSIDVVQSSERERVESSLFSRLVVGVFVLGRSSDVVPGPVVRVASLTR
jgi:hypothetical protein